jgi:hypothetical protein
MSAASCGRISSTNQRSRSRLIVNHLTPVAAFTAEYFRAAQDFGCSFDLFKTDVGVLLSAASGLSKRTPSLPFSTAG